MFSYFAIKIVQM